VGDPSRQPVDRATHRRRLAGIGLYVVRWSEGGHEGLYFSGIDATLVNYANSKRHVAARSGLRDSTLGDAGSWPWRISVRGSAVGPPGVVARPPGAGATLVLRETP
jgi:hypothetical protein